MTFARSQYFQYQAGTNGTEHLVVKYQFIPVVQAKREKVVCRERNYKFIKNNFFGVTSWQRYSDLNIISTHGGSKGLNKAAKIKYEELIFNRSVLPTKNEW